jgi:hypothetical protein
LPRHELEQRRFGRLVAVHHGEDGESERQIEAVDAREGRDVGHGRQALRREPRGFELGQRRAARQALARLVVARARG